MAVAETNSSDTAAAAPPPPRTDPQQQPHAKNHLDDGIDVTSSTPETTPNPRLPEDQTYASNPPHPIHNLRYPNVDGYISSAADEIPPGGMKRFSAVSMPAGVGGFDTRHNHAYLKNGDNGGQSFMKDMRDLEEMFSKLNPMAEEFVPNSLANFRPLHGNNNDRYADCFVVKLPDSANSVIRFPATRKGSYGQGKRRMNSRTTMAQREEVIRRTVYVSDIDQQVTEENLALLFTSCGQVVDCRVCGDPNSVLRFAFIEFTDEEGARNSLSLSGTMLGFYPLRVLPSKTAIAPVNPTLLPRSSDEREMCARTVYCTNIDKKVSQTDVKLFFESLCGEVQRLRLLGDYHHSTRIAFVEFVMAESAIAALNCSGAVLGSLPIRVSPSKTPVRPRSPRPLMH